MLKSWPPVLQTVTVSGDRILKVWWTLRVGPSPIWLVSLEEEEIRRRSTWRRGHMRTQEWDGHKPKKGFHRDQRCPRLDLGWPASRTVRKYIFVVLRYQVCGNLLRQPPTTNSSSQMTRGGKLLVRALLRVQVSWKRQHLLLWLPLK